MSEVPLYKLSQNQPDLRRKTPVEHASVLAVRSQSYHAFTEGNTWPCWFSTVTKLTEVQLLLWDVPLSTFVSVGSALSISNKRTCSLSLEPASTQTASFAQPHNGLRLCGCANHTWAATMGCAGDFEQNPGRNASYLNVLVPAIQ